MGTASRKPDSSISPSRLAPSNAFFFFQIKDVLSLTLARLDAFPLQSYTQREEAQPASSVLLRMASLSLEAIS